MDKRIQKAIKMAGIAHRNQVRKLSDVPYIIHPYTVGMILSQSNCKEDIIIAGILHDIIEDTDTEEKEIGENFGENVLNLVKACTEKNKSETWEKRKEHTINFLRNACCDVKFIILADKLNNIKSIEEDYEEHGDKIWKSFNRGREKQEWYYRNLVEVLYNSCDDENYLLLYNEFQLLVELVFSEN